jgi:hypothetical protein
MKGEEKESSANGGYWLSSQLKAGNVSLAKKSRNDSMEWRLSMAKAIAMAEMRKKLSEMT